MIDALTELVVLVSPLATKVMLVMLPFVLVPVLGMVLFHVLARRSS